VKDGRRLHPDLRAARLSPAEEERHGGHFGTKEACALKAADRFLAVQSRVLAKALGGDRAWLERLERFFEIPDHDYETPGFRRGCLPGNPQETASTNDGLRARIAASFDHWRQTITDALRSAQRAGEADDTLDPEDIGGFTLDPWESAVLQAKAQRPASRCSASAPSCPAAGFDAKRRADHYAIARRGH
jgi:AcrR family transcriptional regulator